MSNKSIKISIGKGFFVGMVDKKVKNISLSEKEWDIIDNNLIKIHLNNYTLKQQALVSDLIGIRYQQILNILDRTDIPNTDMKKVLISLAI
jgi:hypothetical protein